MASSDPKSTASEESLVLLSKDLVNGSHTKPEYVGVRNVRYAASYNWAYDEEQPTIFVPGMSLGHSKPVDAKPRASSQAGLPRGRPARCRDGFLATPGNIYETSMPRVTLNILLSRQ